MVRSMYSGVAGMKANQTRMDVIGNNISNANTYGFKSGRATFRDMYYQQFRGASAGTQTRGGINPSSIGYGAQLSSIDLMMDSSSMTSTGFALDACITGEGFFQVMDPDGNIYFTKAGMLDIDPATGALVDSNGNFVLGTSATEGKLNSSQPGQEKIFITVNSVQASTAKVEKQIAGKTLKIESTEETKEANVSFAFSKSSSMPDGQKIKAIMDSTTSVIQLQLNANETFANMAELQKAINDAITDTYGGKHPAGDFKFSVDPDPFVDADGKAQTLTGAEIVDAAASEYEGGGIEESTVNGEGWANGFKFVETGIKFTGTGAMKMDVKVTADTKATPPVPGYIEVTMTDGAGQTYVGVITKDRAVASSGGSSLLLKRGTVTNGVVTPDANADTNDTITINYPNISEFGNYDSKTGVFSNPKTFTTQNIGTATASAPTKKLGWGKSTLTLEGGTEFHTQDVSNLTGIGIGADGTITGTSDAGLQILGRIDLATFGNAKGLAQAGNSYFTATSNSGPVKLAIAGEQGTGAIRNSALEMSNVDLAQEFSDMIVTQRGFQASSRMITVSDTMLEELINLKR